MTAGEQEQFELHVLSLAPNRGSGRSAGRDLRLALFVILDVSCLQTLASVSGFDCL
jgi:hypothetical protein